MNRKEVNSKIREYYEKIGKFLVERKKVKKKFKPSFTRHNGNRIKRLTTKWRRPKTVSGNKLEGPKIGYKNKKEVRFRKINNLKVIYISNVRDAQKVKLQRSDIVAIKRTVGAKKRTEILKYCFDNKIPLYITK